MNENYTHALENINNAQIDRMNALSDLVDAQDAGADKEDIKQLLKLADRAEQGHNEALKAYISEAVRSISEIFLTMAEVINNN